MRLPLTGSSVDAIISQIHQAVTEATESLADASIQAMYASDASLQRIYSSGGGSRASPDKPGVTRYVVKRPAAAPEPDKSE